LARAESIPVALGEMTQRLDQALNRPSAAMPETAEAAQGVQAGAVDTSAVEVTSQILSHNTNGTLTVYYFCILSYENEKSFDPLKVLTNRFTGFYIQGCIAGFRSYGIMSIDLVNNQFNVTDIKLINPELIKRRIAEAEADQIKNNKREIDAFFAEST
jgi:hypothetical protein